MTTDYKLKVGDGKNIASQANYWHVRISPSKKSVMTDYKKLLESMKDTEKGLWDRDSKNQIASGDYLGFITGLTGNEQIHIYKVVGLLTTADRLSHWASDTPYTAGNGVNIVSYRRETGLGHDCYTWMPRGTQKVCNKETLPFDIDESPKTFFSESPQRCVIQTETL